MAYFIGNQNSTRVRNPNINIISGIHNIKGKTSVNIVVSNYINKHITFNKAEYVAHLEPTIEEMTQTTENPDAPTICHTTPLTEMTIDTGTSEPLS